MLCIVHVSESLKDELLALKDTGSDFPHTFTALHYITLNSYPFYYHQITCHFWEDLEEFGSLRKASNYLFESLGFYHSNLPTGRNGGLNSNPREEILHIGLKQLIVNNDRASDAVFPQVSCALGSMSKVTP